MAGRISSFLVLFMHFRGNACNFGFWVHWERRRSSRNELPIFPFASSALSVPKKMKTRIKHCRSSSVVVCPLNFLIASWNACGNLPLLTVVDLNFCYRIFHFSISTVRIVSGSQFLQTPFIAHFMFAFEIMCKYYAINTLTHFSASIHARPSAANAKQQQNKNLRTQTGTGATNSCTGWITQQLGFC